MTPQVGLLAHLAVPAGPFADAGAAAALVVVGTAYAGALALARRRRGRLPVRSRHVAGFAGGLSALALALLSPLEHHASQRFAAHMIQHLLLIFVAAPLLAWGRPARVVRRSLPPAGRLALHRLGTAPGVRVLARLPVHPVAIWVAGAAGLWAWHSPVLYDLALRHRAVHAAEHVTFLVTAYLFWAYLQRAGRRRTVAARPAALALVFATALTSAALGAILTFAGQPLYAEHATRAAATGISPLEDQQLAGALMWVPPGIAYLATMAMLVVRWFADLDAREAGDADAAVAVPIGGPAA